MGIDKKKIRMLSLLGHRGTFATVMRELVEEKQDICVLTADLGDLTGLEKFSVNYSDNYFNIGIAEQNMIGIAAGLSRYTSAVFATTYANFLTMRAYEQIRMNLGYMQHNVKLIGTGAGFSMGLSGNSHFGLEDISLMRSIPNMVVVYPADCLEEYKVLRIAAQRKEPMYIRLSGPLGHPIVYKEDYTFEIGKAILLKEGQDITIFSMGPIINECLKAAKLLEERGISVCVINMHTIKPIDEECIRKQARMAKLIVTVEEHSIIGGLGSAVAEVMSEEGVNAVHLRLGIPDTFGVAGNAEFLAEYYRLTSDFIAEDIFGKWNSIV